MPHIHIDYSPNVEQRLDMQGLCKALCETAGTTGVFPKAGIRVRAVPCSYFHIADGSPDHAYIDVSVRLREGRDPGAKKSATDALFATLTSYCNEALSSSSIMLSMEMRDINAELSPKKSSIREYLSSDYL